MMRRSSKPQPRRPRRGMVTAQIALSMGMLMGFLALLTDGGILLVERRHAQATADAAALAAASDLYANWNTNKGLDPSGTANSSALGVASANGYTNDGTTSKVKVNISPANYSGGPNAGNALPAGYAEVTVTWYQKRGFSGVLGSGAIPVSARAVARGGSVSGASSLPGVLVLGNTGTTLSGVGNGTVSVTDPTGYTGSGGSIYVDSTGSNAVSMKGNAGVSAPTVYIAQPGAAPSGVTATSGASGIHMGAAPLPDPLSYLPSPVTNPPSGISVVSLPSGITGSMTLTSNTIYILGGNGISLSGNDSVTGSNVMLYLTGANASINLVGNGAVTLSPMTTGPYAGITIFQDRSDSNGGAMKGNGNLNVTGTIYAPAASLEDTGNGTTDVFGSQIIANSLSLKGNGTINVAFDSGASAPVPATRNFGLVE
jgi:Putative Flp pilus-assembly TadE/G-like